MPPVKGTRCAPAPTAARFPVPTRRPQPNCRVHTGRTSFRGLSLGASSRRLTMIEFTRTIVQALVDDPEKVVVTEVSGGQTTLLKIRVGPGEAGRVIGKNGRTIEAPRVGLCQRSAKCCRKRWYLVAVWGSTRNPRSVRRVSSRSRSHSGSSVSTSTS